MKNRQKVIKLSNGGVCIVDSCDYDWLSLFSWYHIRSRQSLYAKTGNRRMHRMILGLDNPKLIVDHINGDGLDNRRSNLRVVTTRENVQNRQNSRAGNRYPGVFMACGKWRATLCVDYRKITVGSFSDELEALDALNRVRLLYGRPPIVQKRD